MATHIYRIPTYSFSTEKAMRNVFGPSIDGLAQDCSNSIANALELLQSCTKPLIYCHYQRRWRGHEMSVCMSICSLICQSVICMSKTLVFTQTTEWIHFRLNWCIHSEWLLEVTIVSIYIVLGTDICEGRYWFQCIGYDYTAYLYGPRCPLSPERPLNLGTDRWPIQHTSITGTM